jgi:1,4-alpha-glucan branching enzyme
MLEENIRKIIELRHDAPYEVLGPHYDSRERTLTIRAFLPQAERVYLAPMDGTGKREMRRLHPDGLFALQIPGVAKLDYQLMAVAADGQALTFHDAYAIHAPSITDAEGRALQQGTLNALYEQLGAHPVSKNGIAGVNFALWAPHASRVSVVGTFNQWDGRRHPMERHPSGVWELFVPGIGAGDLYKFEIRNAEGAVFLKTDPLAFQAEVYPSTAAQVCDLEKLHPWADSAWMTQARETPAWKLPVAIHRVTLDENTGYRQLLNDLLPQWLENKPTHVELACWAPGETVASYFTPNPRYGRPEELMAFIDACHQQGIGVIFDWIPPFIPLEGQELTWFDGARIYDADAPGQPDKLTFDLEKPEVRNFLAANARFWRQVYHVDALRTDARTFAARLAQSPIAQDLPCLLQDDPAWPTLDAGARDALIQGRHSHPHEVLGPHPLDETGLHVVRAFLPDAELPCLLPDDGPHLLYPLLPLYDGGLFETTVVADAEPFRYQIGATEHGQFHLFADPYATTFSMLSDQDCYLFAEGNHYQIYENLGAHPCEVAGRNGVNFAVWAPNAQRVSVVGTFNHWDGRRHPMRLRPGSGIWELFVPGLAEGELYKFEILARNGNIFLKTDPVAFHTETPPGTASVVYDQAGKHVWRDGEWMQQRAREPAWRRPVAIYEVHAGSWRHKPNGEFLSYRELADQLIPYVLKMGFTHIEFLPLAEHPYGPSWGYQISNFYAPTARFGRPDDLMELIDRCHQNGIGVILDWVPAHFPKDAHAMAWFDGTCVYEHADPRQGEHPDWGTLIFNYGRHEVENFLIANALYWLHTFHFDGLRVDAVASMLYLDYSKKDWIPNKYGGNENLEAIEFIKHTNAVVHARFPGVMMIAEESTAWPNVSRPTDVGGLGFGFKWNMGWMHDVLFYMQKDPVHRRYHHDKLTFGIVYAFNENFILSLSHDEVVHLKKSLLGKMPGSEREQFANLRLLYAFMYGHPGKKLLFMGGEFGQPGEWNHDGELDWVKANLPPHQGLQHFLAALNKLYAREPAFYQVDFHGAGFDWIDPSGAETSVLAFQRKARDPRDALVFVFNFADVPRPHYRIGVPYPVEYRELLNSDAREFGGSGLTLPGGKAEAEEYSSHGFPFSLVLDLPPLGGVVLKPGPPKLG